MKATTVYSITEHELRMAICMYLDNVGEVKLDADSIDLGYENGTTPEHPTFTSVHVFPRTKTEGA